MRSASLEKLAIRIKGLHGTSGKWDVLQPRFGGTIAKNEVNPVGVYAATKKRSLLEILKNYARGATKVRGGTPTVSTIVIDTQKGWVPSALGDPAKEVARRGLGTTGPISARDTREYFTDLIEEGDDLLSAIKLLKREGTSPQKVRVMKKEMGNIYRQLNELGSWRGPATKTIRHQTVK